mmetsp:Transcript_1851/g.3227  ORF Transcript_1851/g.3227 Transcript_1851/m.3227 type:complete len:227 (+) Transcript_1851:45-725(+)
MAAYRVRFLAVARLQDRVPLAYYTQGSDSQKDTRADLYEGKFRKLLASGRVADHARLTVTDRDIGNIHFECDPVCLYLVVCDPQYPQRVAFQLLKELSDAFAGVFGPDVRTAREGELNKQAKKMMKQMAERYEDLRNVDQVEDVKVQVDEVKGVMESNIQQALKNQENLDTLIDKTDVMRNEANQFQKTSVAVKNKFWWQNTTYLILIGVALVVLVLVIVLPIVLN